MSEVLQGRHDDQPRLAGQNRIRLVAICFSLAFFAIAVQLGNLTIIRGVDVEEDALAQHQPRMPRPERPNLEDVSPEIADRIASPAHRARWHPGVVRFVNNRRPLTRDHGRREACVQPVPGASRRPDRTHFPAANRPVRKRS